MERVRQPKTPQKLIPVIRNDDTKKALATCKGKTFLQLPDEAIIRLYCNTGARLSEVGNVTLDDIVLNSDSVHYHGKGSRDRRVRFGPRTARAITRYLRARAKHQGAALPDLWLTDRGGRRLDIGARTRLAKAVPKADELDAIAQELEDTAEDERRADADRRQRRNTVRSEATSLGF
ncbi:tyrosine-type recombinase/integrase [Streptomyces sp. KR80]|uniref:tyrosine-type recombinase/integrase n=1 Tax=Streptomyces sp. KR80 TaxID=3457426 RepID=UPI003FD2FD23